MTMSKSLKKILVSGVSLLMLAGVSAGVSQVHTPVHACSDAVAMKDDASTWAHIRENEAWIPHPHQEHHQVLRQPQVHYQVRKAHYQVRRQPQIHYQVRKAHYQVRRQPQVRYQVRKAHYNHNYSPRIHRSHRHLARHVRHYINHHNHNHRRNHIRKTYRHYRYNHCRNHIRRAHRHYRRNYRRAHRYYY